MIDPTVFPIFVEERSLTLRWSWCLEPCFITQNTRTDLYTCSFRYFLALDLPSFLWLWKIAAWSMGLSILAYILLATSGGWMVWRRKVSSVVEESPQFMSIGVVRSLHYAIGWILVALVLLLLGIGIVGTLGHYGSLGHSPHLIAGLIVVVLVLFSAWTATQISAERPWVKRLHISINALLFFCLTWVSWTGWSVVQKYLP